MKNKLAAEDNSSNTKANPDGLAVLKKADSGSTDDSYIMNGLTLAYIGDAVFELMVRQHMLSTGSRQADKLHKHTIALVNAGSQSAMIMHIMEMLTERELSVYKRGRNSSTVTSAKHQSVNDYRRATGLEALFGYLYLNKEYERLKELFGECMNAVS
ncbi:MAG: hypothetical protein MR011_03345 [Lachnospiraceae bacterium]|nr:hypothetical protein [Lachnospiraceae bacterium]